MAKLKFKSNGKWESIAAFQGEPGKDGAIQYTAGKGITIENDTISAEVTKQYVDEAVASGSSSSDLIYDEIILDGEYNVNVSGRDSITITITDTIATEKMSNFITNAYLNYNTDSVAKIGLLIRYKEITGNSNLTSLMPMMFNFLNFKYLVQNTYYELYHIRQESQSILDRYRLFIKGTWSDNVFTATKIFIDKTRTDIDCLPKTNTKEYVPTSNYHPATKKYVDDAIAGIDIPESGGSTIDFGNTPVYLVSTKSGMNETSQHYILNDDNAPGYGASLRNAVSSGLKQFIISIFFTGHGMSMNLRYTIDDNGSILVILMQQPIQVSSGNYIIGYSPVVENMVTNISSVETASMYLRVQYMNNPTLCPVEKNTATKSYVDNAIAALRAELGGE